MRKRSLFPEQPSYNTCCFPTTTMVVRTRLNVTLYVLCLACYISFLLSPEQQNHTYKYNVCMYFQFHRLFPEINIYFIDHAVSPKLPSVKRIKLGR
jgi:hypothetical protein